MTKSKNKFGKLEKFELIYAVSYLIIGKLLYEFAERGLVSAVLFLCMTVFTVLLIVFRKHHVYWQDKPLLTVLSFYYKSLTYTIVIFTMCNYSGKAALNITAMASFLIYSIFAYFNGKQYNQMLNAYLYLQMLAFIRYGLLENW